MGRPPEFEEEEVVADAIQAFWKRGYASTSIPDLMAATDLERGSIYKAFGDKYALFERALGTYLETGLAGMLNALQSASSPLLGIERGLVVIAVGLFWRGWRTWLHGRKCHGRARTERFGRAGAPSPALVCC